MGANLRMDQGAELPSGRRQQQRRCKAVTIHKPRVTSSTVLMLNQAVMMQVKLPWGARERETPQPTWSRDESHLQAAKANLRNLLLCGYCPDSGMQRQQQHTLTTFAISWSAANHPTTTSRLCRAKPC